MNNVFWDFFTSLDSIEAPWILQLQNLDGTDFDSFYNWVSNIPLLLGFFGVILGILYIQKEKILKPLLFSFFVSISLNFLVNEFLFKHILKYFGIFRPRPWTIHPDILAIGFPFQDSSFPSSHMAITTLFVIITTYFEKKFLPYGMILIIIMGLSRVHNGMHYPSDVIVGILMGTLYGFAGLYLMKKFGIEKQSWWRKLFR